jgi:hypothetical protein
MVPAGGRAFGWLTVLPALAIAAWCLPGLPLLLTGRFGPTAMVLISVPVAAGFALLAAWSVPRRWPVPSAARPPGAGRPRRGKAAWWGLAGTAVVAAGFGAWQVVFNSPQLIVLRDPGALMQAGYWAAEHGSLPVPGLLPAFGTSHPGLSLASFGLAVHGGGLLPRLPPGLPIVLAAGLWTHGVAGSAVTFPVLGALAVLTVGGLTGRLAGPQWAPAGALALALTLPEVVTSRSAYPEIALQILVFGGLSLVTDSLVVMQRPPGETGGGDAGAGGTVPPAAAPQRRAGRLPAAIVLGCLGGLTLGLTTLLASGFIGALLPVIPFGAILALRRWKAAIPFGIGIVIGAGYGIAGSMAQAGGVTRMLGPWPRPLGLAAAGFAAVTLLGAAAGRWRAVRRLLARRPLRWLPGAVAVLVVAAAAALAARPYLQTVRGGTASGYVTALQRLAGLPADPRRLYAEDTLYWVIWYLGLPALLLAVGGLALLARRCLRALLTWRDAPGPAGSGWIQALPLMIIGWVTAVVLWQPGTVPDQPWAGRVLVPVVLPGLCACAVWAVAWLVAWARLRGAGVIAVSSIVVFFAVALAVPAAVTTFGAGAGRYAAAGSGAPGAGARYTLHEVTVGGAGLARTGTGELAAVRQLCGHLGGNASVVILDQTAGREFAPVIRSMCGLPAGIMAGAQAADVQVTVRSIAQAGRRPVLLGSLASELAPYQAPVGQVLNLATTQDEHLLTRPPGGVWPARYALWLSRPAVAAGA